MIRNYMCEHCDKAAVCKIADIIAKFSEDTRTPLGVDIAIERCVNYQSDDPEFEEPDTKEDES